MLVESACMIIFATLLLACFDLITSVLTYYNINQNSNGNQMKQARSKMWPTEITLSHCLKFIEQKINYEIQATTALLYVVCLHTKVWLKISTKHGTADDVVSFVLNSSFAILLTPEDDSKATDNTEASTDEVRYTLTMDKFKWPLFRSSDLCNSLKVTIGLTYRPDGEHCPIEVRGAKVIVFTINDIEVLSYEAQLAILTLLVAWVVHPHLHAFNNAVYKERHHTNARKYDDFFLHGQYLNYIAHVYPAYLIGLAPKDAFDAICFNKSMQIRMHSFQSLRVLAKYSRFIRFGLFAKKIIDDIHKEYQLPGKSHELFVTSILHSLDHYGVWSHVKGIYLNLDGLPFGHHTYCNLFAAMFVAPCQCIFKNLLKSKQNKTKAYKELYQRLASIDKELADNVTLSISY